MSKAEGYKDQAVGAVKETVGSAVGNTNLQAEGIVQKKGGEAEVEGVKASNRLDGHGDQVVGKGKEIAGAVVGDRSLEAEGIAQGQVGKAKVATNQ